MDQNQFKLIEALIPGDEVVEALDAATNQGDLVMAALRAANQYGIRPPALIDWYEVRLRFKEAALKAEIHGLSPSVT